MSAKSLLFICLILGVATLALADSSKPSLVINLFRHGHRGPQWAKHSPGFTEAEIGVLTPVGMRMHYVLGASLLKDYPHLLNKPYDPSRIYVRSSAVFRAYQSVTSQLFGVFGQRKMAQMSSSLEKLALPAYDKKTMAVVLEELKAKTSQTGNFQKAEITVVPEDDDIVLKTPATCPSLMAKAALQVLKPESLIFNHKYSDPAQEEATKKGGVKIDNTLEIAQLVDSMYSNHFGGRAQPGKITWDSQVSKDLIHVRDWYFVKGGYDSSKQKEMLAVPLFEEIFRHLDAKAAGKSNTEFVFLSSHDVTLMTILSTLDIVNPECVTANYIADKTGKALPYPACEIPPFASNIIFEFYNEDNGSKSIALKYNGANVPLCRGQARCEFNEFKNLVKKATNGYTTKDYEKTCKNDLKNEVVDKFKSIKGFFKGTKEPSEQEAQKIFNEKLNQLREEVVAKLFA